LELAAQDIQKLLEQHDIACACKVFSDLDFLQAQPSSLWFLLRERPSELRMFFRQGATPIQQTMTSLVSNRPFETWDRSYAYRILRDLEYDLQEDQLGFYPLELNGYLLISPTPAEASTSHRMLCAWTPVLSQKLDQLHTQRQLTERASFSEETEMRMAALIAELRQARQRADAANRAKSVFLANMSHELRTPLNGLLGLNEVLLTTPLDDQQKELLATMNDSGQQLRELIDNLLDFSHIESRHLQLERETFAIRALVESLAGTIGVQLQEGVELKLELIEPLPQFISTDPIRLRQILLNLLGNAAKFTETGQIIFRVQLVKNQNPEEGVIQFEIQDSGIGIPKEKQDRIFDAFYQADSSITKRHEGVGLGLSIARKLVQMMGGRLRFESEVNKGSRFWFQLKLAIADQPEQMPQDSEDENDDTDFLKQAHLLLVEDNRINQMVTQRMLKNYGCSIDIANNGQEALDMLQDQHYDLVLMDVSMPVMDGLEATRRIRSFDARENTHTLIVALTAHALVGDREKCLAAGMDDYLAKPARSDQLLQTLKKWIR
jgi:signal transduction histidine kinase/ActR/RegA family two-component response regulator